MPFIVQVLIAVAMMIVSYMLMPKPKQTSQETQPGEAPTASAGRPVPVIFGTMRVKDPNCLWYGDVYYRESTVES